MKQADKRQGFNNKSLYWQQAPTSTKGSVFTIERLRKTALDTVPAFGFALLFSLAWTAMSLKGVGLSMDWPLQSLYQLSCLICAALLLGHRKVFLLAASLCLAYVMLSTTVLQSYNLPFSRSFFQEIGNSFLWSFARTQGELVKPLHYEIFLGLSASLVAFWLIYLKPSPLILLPYILMPFMGQGGELSRDPNNMWFLIPCLAALAFCFARRHKLKSSPKIVSQFPPLISIALLLACTFVLQAALPEHFLRNSLLADRMHELKRRFGEPETVNYFEFSIRQASYYPLGERLGGPLNLNHQGYMRLVGPSSALYLRASLASDFTGQSWNCELMEPNYIFRNDEIKGIQAEVFSYPSTIGAGAQHLSKLFSQGTVQIYPLQLPVQVIFNGGRPTAIVRHDKGEHAVYFNQGGQLYAGTNLGETGYRVEGWFASAAAGQKWEQELRAAVSAGEVQAEEDSTQRPAYHSEVEQFDPELAHITYAQTASASASLEKLLQIRQYLAHNYRYATDVSYPPAETDFFTHFLREKEGYCVYFATAMTLLAREAGFKSRYVEGFLVPSVPAPNNSSAELERLVLSDSAHAWTEIYFSGLGWIPFDATPADTLANLSNEKAAETEAPAQTTKVEQTPPPPPSRAETSKPENSPPPQATTAPPTRANKQPPTAPEQALSPKVKLLLWLLLLILLFLILLASFIYWRKEQYKRRHDSIYLLRKYNMAQTELLYLLWQDMKAMLLLSGAVIPTNATLLKTFALLERRFSLPEKSLGKRCFTCLEKGLYGDCRLNEQQWDTVFSYHAGLEVALKAKVGKRKWVWSRWLFPTPKLF